MKKVYVKFWHKSTGWNGKDFSGPAKLIPACGSDSEMPLDARYSMGNLCQSAREIAKKLEGVKKYPAFRIMLKCEGKKTHSFYGQDKPLTPVLSVNGQLELKPDTKYL